MKDKRRCLPIEEWPEADRTAWQEATQDGGVLDVGGRASHLAEATISDLTLRYGRFLGYLQNTGILDRSGPPAANLTPENVMAYIPLLKETVASVTVHGCVVKAVTLARFIAPNRDYEWTRPILRRLDFEARPKEKRSKVVDSGRLFALGVKLMTDADAYRGRARLRPASTYRNGLMIAMLAICPVRLKNFTALQLDKSLIRTDDGWAISIAAEDSKSRRPIEMSLPDNHKMHLEHYLKRYRPLYPSADDTNALWLSTHGGQLTPGAISRIICQNTKCAFGHAVNPHLFRNCAATTVATRAGSRMGTAVALLAHRDIRTIDKHYNQANMITAAQDYQKLLDSLLAPYRRKP